MRLDRPLGRYKFRLECPHPINVTIPRLHGQHGPHLSEVTLIGICLETTIYHIVGSSLIHQRAAHNFSNKVSIGKYKASKLGLRPFASKNYYQLINIERKLLNACC